MAYGANDRDTALAVRGRDLEFDRDSGNGSPGTSTGRMVVGLVTIGAAIGIGYLLMKNMPEVRRYLRIRAM